MERHRHSALFKDDATFGCFVREHPLVGWMSEQVADGLKCGWERPLRSMSLKVVYASIH